MKNAIVKAKVPREDITIVVKVMNGLLFSCYHFCLHNLTIISSFSLSLHILKMFLFQPKNILKLFLNFDDFQY